MFDYKRKIQNSKQLVLKVFITLTKESNYTKIRQQNKQKGETKRVKLYYRVYHREEKAANNKEFEKRWEELCEAACQQLLQ